MDTETGAAIAALGEMMTAGFARAEVRLDTMEVRMGTMEVRMGNVESPHGHHGSPHGQRGK